MHLTQPSPARGLSWKKCGYVLGLPTVQHVERQTLCTVGRSRYILGLPRGICCIKFSLDMGGHGGQRGRFGRSRGVHWMKVQLLVAHRHGSLSSRKPLSQWVHGLERWGLKTRTSMRHHVAIAPSSKEIFCLEDVFSRDEPACPGWNPSSPSWMPDPRNRPFQGARSTVSQPSQTTVRDVRRPSGVSGPRKRSSPVTRREVELF